MIAGLVVELASAPMDGAPSVMVSVSAAMPALDAGTGAANGLMANPVRPAPLRPTFGVLPVLGGAIFTVTDRGIARSAPHLSALALCLLSLSALGDAVQHGTVFCRQLVLIGANPRAAALAGGGGCNRHPGTVTSA
jgi:ribose/xylose/arabinose/galactoside ABC-type transport system permease subunit